MWCLSSKCYALLAVAIAAWLCLTAHAQPARFTFRDDFFGALANAVPRILASQDKATGRFGRGIWICNDQEVMFLLAVAWAADRPGNPHFHDPAVLEAIMVGGDALTADQDAKGMWEFRKKDGSTWGPIYMPWTYSRWIRAYGLIRDAMPKERRERWDRALLLGFDGISKTCLDRVHNIPAHHAMALYHAGQLLGRQEWCDQAKAFMAHVVAAQDPGGYWVEHMGPVVSYNFVYSDALGVYYAFSHDETVLPALERAAAFHANFTYPDGSPVETVDERNPYHRGIRLGTVGFSLSDVGRGFLAHQWELMRAAGRNVDADTAAGLFQYAEEGPAAPTAAGRTEHTGTLGDNDALVRREAPWFVCLSAFCCPVTENRWMQDRQNLVSIYHDRCGLIVGGGNTKLQPLWSNFTVGDVSLLSHKPGDTDPNFLPPEGLFHLPSRAALTIGDAPGLDLAYGQEQCRITVDPADAARCRITLEATSGSGLPVAAHVTLLPHMGEELRTAAGLSEKLGEAAIEVKAGEVGEWVEHHGWRLHVPPDASLRWPVLPHNPYRKDGSATASEGRIVVTVPFGPEHNAKVLELEVEK